MAQAAAGERDRNRMDCGRCGRSVVDNPGYWFDLVDNRPHSKGEYDIMQILNGNSGHTYQGTVCINCADEMTPHAPAAPPWHGENYRRLDCE